MSAAMPEDTFLNPQSIQALLTGHGAVVCIVLPGVSYGIFVIFPASAVEPTMGRARRNSPKTTPAPTLVTKKHTPQTARPVIQQNSHRYYISQYYPVFPPGDSHWEDMGSGDAELVVGTGSPPVHHKQNKPVSLSFDFKFYGHFIRNISISTRGYINTGPYPSYVTDTQYIAPLSDPRLDSSLDKFASVRYKDSEVNDLLADAPLPAYLGRMPTWSRQRR
ncbi:Plexin domain-containing protein 2 [Branchiostoma belcheri]|nr:Plexin domain-containing protein 2 [Branchiostoma belcheri]